MSESPACQPGQLRRSFSQAARAAVPTVMRLMRVSSYLLSGLKLLRTPSGGDSVLRPVLQPSADLLALRAGSLRSRRCSRSRARRRGWWRRWRRSAAASWTCCTTSCSCAAPTPTRSSRRCAHSPGSQPGAACHASLPQDWDGAWRPGLGEIPDYCHRLPKIA